MQNKIETLARQACDELEMYLVEVRIRGDKRQPIFEIFADTEKGITLKECEILTRTLQDLIDMDDNFQGNYRLNVSSPGLDRSLTRNFEFKRNIGQLLIVKLRSADGVIEKVGELAGFDDENLQLIVNEKMEIINRADLEEAKVKIKW